MALRFFKPILTNRCKLLVQTKKNLSLSVPSRAKVMLVGAAGGIGQPLALLLKYNPMVLNLTLFDAVNTAGIAMDLSHIDTSTKVFSCDSIAKEAENSDIVVIAAGRARKQGMTRDDLFKMNADIVKGIIDELLKIKHCPKIAIITNPINSIVPFAYRYYSKMCSPQSPDFYNRIFGITTLDCVRASTFYANYLGKDPRDVIVPVVGGHSDTTMVPLFSMSNFPLDDESVALRLTKEIREAGTKVVEAKKGAGSATLSMAYAANRFINSLLEAHYGKHTTECSFIFSAVHDNFSFFSEMVRLNNLGLEKTVSFDHANQLEIKLLDEITPYLEKDITKGLEYADSLITKSS